MAVRVWLAKDKKKRRIGFTQLAFGIICLLISIGLIATSEKYGLPLFALLVSLYMILNARETLMVD
ncbi:hypothetical protein KY308_02940 [Candidatus Woesearchaeota archaeon]|nr:hypothetical protein [Candidatus Woesearchaeota archaeon]